QKGLGRPDRDLGPGLGRWLLGWRRFFLGWRLLGRGWRLLLGRRWRRLLGRRRLVRRRRGVRGMVMTRLSEDDFQRVSEAVAKAERESDGEIVTIVAHRSDAYHD